MRHCLWIQSSVELFSSHQSTVANEIVNSPAAHQRFLGDFGAGLVAQDRHERASGGIIAGSYCGEYAYA